MNRRSIGVILCALTAACEQSEHDESTAPTIAGSAGAASAQSGSSGAAGVGGAATGGLGGAGSSGPGGTGGTSGTGGTGGSGGTEGTAGGQAAGGMGTGGGFPSAPLCKPGEGPELLATADNPLSLSVFGGRIYWNDTMGRLQSVSLEAPEPKPVQLSSGQGFGQTVLAADGWLYWNSQGGPWLRKRSLTTQGAPIDVIKLNDGDSQGSFVIDAGSIFLVASSGVYESKLSPGAPTKLSSTMANPGGIRVNASEVFFSRWTPVGSSSNKVEILRSPRSGGVASSFANDDGQGYLALGEGHLYWTSAKALKRKALSGGAVETLVQGLEKPGRLQVTGETVYWVNGGGTLQKLTVGQAPVTMVSGQKTLIHITMDDSCVYWAEYATAGRIQRIAR